MNDFDQKIVSMWKNEIQDFVQLFCFVHLQRNVKKRLLPKDSKKEILKDIDFLALSTSLDEFNARWLLVKNYWKEKNEEKINNFLTYFEEQYITKNSNWFLGVCPIGLGNTNNSIEGFNCALKKNFVNYQRQDIVRFLL